MIKFFFVLLVSSFFLVSCNHPVIPENVKNVLALAGKNRDNLEAVLKHYSKKKDSLKFRAACYLIENMSGHYAYYLNNQEEYDPVFSMIANENQANKRALWDSAATIFKKIDFSEIKRLDDLNTISSKFLIDNIDASFYAWEHYPWCSGIDFNKFKKYILPYRATTEPLQSIKKSIQKDYAWVMDSVKGGACMEDVFTLIYNNFYSHYEISTGVKYPISLSYGQIIKAKGGRCADMCNLLNMIMKSMGVVSVIDIVTHWANRNSGHLWVAFLDKKGNPLTIADDNQLRKRDYLNSGKFVLDTPGIAFFDDNIQVEIYKKASKVFRKTFEINNESLCYETSSYSEKTPAQIDDLFNYDVSSFYLKTKNIELTVPNTYGKNFAYLCIFDFGEVYPVHWARIVDNKVIFKDIGNDVLYFPAIFKDGVFIPFADPLLLHKNGELSTKTPGLKKSKNMMLTRKYPLFGNILNYANRMFGGKFQGSNLPDFSEATELYSVNKTFIKYNEVTIHDTKPYRYVRYLAPKQTNGDVAEIRFFASTGKKDREITGQYIYKNKGAVTKEYFNAFDNNLDSYYFSEVKDAWIGIDLGENNQKKVTKIGFCPRTDSNFIIPGLDYELFYWQNGWLSLGRKIADSYLLNYQNVPSGAVFWLHCHSGGKEERIFTYENNRQIWW